MPLRSRGRRRADRATATLRPWPKRPRGIDAVGVDDAAVMARGDRDEPPVEVEPVGDLVEQPQKPPADVAEADKRQGELRRLMHRDQSG